MTTDPKLVWPTHEPGRVGIRFVDRAGWPRGPWDGEPDRYEWEEHGLPCLLRRNHFGAWCGYVAVPPRHPFHGRGYDDLDGDGGPLVHGGLTFAGPCEGREDPRAVCQAPRDGEPADVWWFGFDCAHCDDVVPGMGFATFPGAEYRTIEYAQRETSGLAAQLAARGKLKGLRWFLRRLGIGR